MKNKSWAQAELFKMFSGKLFGVCLYYSDNKEDAEDLLHDGFLKVFDKIGDFRNENLEAWMRRIVVNLALMRFRHKKFEVKMEDMEPIINKSGSFDMQAEMNSDEIMKMVLNLPQQYRIVFNLYALEGYKHKEISDLLGITESTSKSNLSRARAILQEKLNQVEIAR
jgi:RNA polymerase sigma factor (sigma-70 family)